MRIGCIIPAYNEEKTIAEIINVVKSTKVVSEIIVVSDGSTDCTAEIARQMGVTVLEQLKNMGKGAAVSVGIKVSTSDVILFLDADLIGIKREHIIGLLKPVIEGESDMSVGVFSRCRIFTDLAQKIAPSLSGQRAVKRDILLKVNNLESTGYGMEMALTKAAKKENLLVKEVELRDMTHVMKEEKLGFRRGVISRMKMYVDILRCIWTY